MADDTTNEGTPEITPEAQPQVGTPPVDNSEVTTLRSRTAGLDAKVTELQRVAAEAAAARAAAEARLAEYESGKANESEAARAQIERLNAELAAAKQTSQVNSLKATYPESYSVYGEAIAGMSEDVLAAGEARLRGVPAESNVPTPIGNNAARSLTPVKTIEEMSLAELQEHGKSAFAGLTWGQLQGD